MGIIWSWSNVCKKRDLKVKTQQQKSSPKWGLGLIFSAIAEINNAVHSLIKMGSRDSPGPIRGQEVQGGIFVSARFALPY